MKHRIDAVWFDWKAADELVQFIQDVTATQPMCFRKVDTGDDAYVLVVSPQPISQQEAIEAYQQVVQGPPAKDRRG